MERFSSIRSFHRRVIVIGLVLGAIVVIALLLGGTAGPDFVETCDHFDRKQWKYYWNPPVVVGDGTWLFEFPAGERHAAQAVRHDFTDYGTYSLRFRVSDRHPPELAWYGMFIFGESRNEIDFPELQGSFGPQTLSIAMWSYDASGNRIINPNEVNGQWYWFFDSATDFEDGDWHTWKVVYTPDQIDFYTDDILDFTVTNHNNSYWNVTGIDFFPTVGDMQVIVGGGTTTAPSVTWQFIIDEITYTRPPEQEFED